MVRPQGALVLMNEIEPDDLDLVRRFAFDELSNPELTSFYLRLRSEYRQLIKRLERMSRGAGGILSTGNRMFWGSVLFTRISVTAKSIDKLLPDPRPREVWDFSAAASLVRNLLEAELVYQWLCADGPDDVTREARFILLYLHDRGSRYRLFPPDDENADAEVLQDLVRRFDANPVLAAYDERRRKVALKGEKTPFIQDDVLAEMNVHSADFRRLYRFLSQHTHTGPIAFYRQAEQDRGAGVETRMEKIYLIIAIAAAYDALGRVMNVHLQIFPDAETRKPWLTPQQIVQNVEEAQGRAKRRK
jgi:hypothetical protein